MSTTRNHSTCPNCGTKAGGNFCPNCGGTLAGARCPKCGTSVQAGSKFCHNCSAKLGTGGETRAAKLPWVVAGIVGVALIIFAVVRFGPPGGAPPAPIGFPAPAAPQTPRDIANEYFNQSMMAYERGDSAGAASYGQMAIAGYTALGGLDNDLRLHVGLIYLAMGNLDGVLLQADSLELAVPGHLYASILRQRVYEIQGDVVGERTAYGRFLEYHQTEINAGRPEYNEHMRMIETFLEAARSATAR